MEANFAGSFLKTARTAKSPTTIWKGTVAAATVKGMRNPRR